MAFSRIKTTEYSETVTREEYLRLDEKSEERLEFDDGVVTAMAGASIAHGLIASSISRHLGNSLVGRNCYIMSQGTRVSISLTKRYYYPDVVLVCGATQIERNRGESLLNPVLVAEVLSPSTCRRDRGIKLKQYRSLPSLHYYLIVNPLQPLVELYRRDGDEWAHSYIVGLGAIVDLTDLGCTLQLSDIYDQIGFDTESDDDDALAALDGE